MKPPLSTLPQVGAFSVHCFSQTPQSCQVKRLVNSLIMRVKFFVDNSSRIDETKQHHLDIGFHLTCCFWVVVKLDASTDLTAVLFQFRSHSTSFLHQRWSSKIGLNQHPALFSVTGTHSFVTAFVHPSANEEAISLQLFFIPGFSVKIHFQELQDTPVKSISSSVVRQWSVKISSWIFRNAFIRSGSWWSPWTKLVFQPQVIISKACKPLLNLCFPPRSFLEAVWCIIPVSAAVFPSKKQDLMAARCSFLSFIEKLDEMERKTSKQGQTKSCTSSPDDPSELMDGMSNDSFMRYLAADASTNTGLSHRKLFRLLHPAS